MQVLGRARFTVTSINIWGTISNQIKGIAGRSNKEFRIMKYFFPFDIYPPYLWRIQFLVRYSIFIRRFGGGFVFII